MVFWDGFSSRKARLLADQAGWVARSASCNYLIYVIFEIEPNRQTKWVVVGHVHS